MRTGCCKADCCGWSISMEGDLANLPEIVRLKKKYNASIYVDEAHGLGVFGNKAVVCATISVLPKM